MLINNNLLEPSLSIATRVDVSTIENTIRLKSFKLGLPKRKLSRTDKFRFPRETIRENHLRKSCSLALAVRNLRHFPLQAPSVYITTQLFAVQIYVNVDFRSFDH